MQYRPLGESGIKASVVALGTWAIGGWMWGGTDETDSIDAIHAGLDAGINLIDTAPVYGFGRSEELVGKAIAGRRDNVVLATKCGLVWHTDGGDFFFHSDGQHPVSEKSDREVHRYIGPDSIKYEVEQSLKRLGTDRIDLYQTHWQETTTPIADSMGALMELKQEGKVLAIGVSNATCAQMDEYRAAGQLDCDQERYSMLDRGLDAEQLPYCAKNNVAVLAYSPLALGLLTGKIGPDRIFNEGDQRKNNGRFSPENLKKVHAMLSEIQPIADAHSVTMAQLVIAWTVAQPGLTHALVGARNPQQARENAAAGDVTLSADELKTIDKAISKCDLG